MAGINDTGVSSDAARSRPWSQSPDPHYVGLVLRHTRHEVNIDRRHYKGIAGALASEPRPFVDPLTAGGEEYDAETWGRAGRVLRRAIVAAGGTRRELEYLRVSMAQARRAPAPPTDDPVLKGEAVPPEVVAENLGYEEHYLWLDTMLRYLVGYLAGIGGSEYPEVVSVTAAVVAKILEASAKLPIHPLAEHHPDTGLHDPAISAAVVPTGPPATTDRTTPYRVLSVAA